MGSLCCGGDDFAGASKNARSPGLMPHYSSNVNSWELPDTEKVIESFEIDCPFSRLNITYLANAVLEECMDNRLSIFQLRKLFKQFSLQKSLLEDPDSPCFKLLYSMREDKLYNGPKILLAGLLLSQSKLREKGFLLFDLFDSNKNNFLDISELNNLVSAVFDTSVGVLPLLAVDNGITDEQLQEYQDLLYNFKDDFVGIHVNKIIGHNRYLTKEIFLKNISECKHLFNASELRKNILWEYISNI